MRKFSQLRMMIMVLLILIFSDVLSIDGWGDDWETVDVLHCQQKDVNVDYNGTVSIQLINCCRFVAYADFFAPNNQLPANALLIYNCGHVEHDSSCTGIIDGRKLKPGKTYHMIYSLRARAYDKYYYSNLNEITVHVIPSGTFTFASQGNSITSANLDLAADTQTGTITLQNTGAGDITALQVNTTKLMGADILDSNSSCFSKSSLPLAANTNSCEIKYHIPDNPPEGPVKITATGTHVTNSGAALTINIKTGHFTFRNANDTQNISELNLKPGDTGTIQLKNTGSADISDFRLPQLPSTPGITFDQTGSACPFAPNATKSLNQGTNCTLKYTVSPNADQSNLRLTSHGKGAGNNGTAILNININKIGYAVFRDAQSKQNITHLDLQPGDTGAFEVYNAGNTTITDIRLLGSALTGPGNILTAQGRCASSFYSLRPGTGCTIKYNIPSDSAKKIITLAVNGNPYSTANSGMATLIINISPSGHFVFLNDEGKHINTLYLKSGDSGIFKLRNVGHANISNVTLLGLSSGNSGMICPANSTLASGKECFLAYSIAENSTLQDAFILTASGSGADNNGSETLTVSINS